MTILRYPANRANGLPSSDYWYVANEYADGTFTVTLNKGKARTFATPFDADLFNERQMRLGHIVAPFQKIKA